MEAGAPVGVEAGAPVGERGTPDEEAGVLPGASETGGDGGERVGAATGVGVAVAGDGDWAWDLEGEGAAALGAGEDVLVAGERVGAGPGAWATAEPAMRAKSTITTKPEWAIAVVVDAARALREKEKAIRQKRE